MSQQAGQRKRSAEEWARLFAALGSPTRLRMLSEIDGGCRTTTALAGRLALSRAVVDRHLKTLEGAGLVANTRGQSRAIRFNQRELALEEEGREVFSLLGVNLAQLRESAGGEHAG